MQENRFISPLTDFGFKKIFGDKKVLLTFLNDLFDGVHVFKDLKYIDKESKGDTEESKTIFYDLLCTTDGGEKIIVEMQNQYQSSFRNRIVYYTSRAVSTQGQIGDEKIYQNLKVVYGVFFTNFELLENTEKQSSGLRRHLRHDIKLMDLTTGEEFSDKIHIICLQVPLADMEVRDNESKLNVWMYNIKNMGTMEQLVNKETMPIFKRLEKIAERRKLTEKEKLDYELSYMRWMDSLNYEDERAVAIEEAKKAKDEMEGYKQRSEEYKLQSEEYKLQSEEYKQQSEEYKQQSEAMESALCVLKDAIKRGASMEELQKLVSQSEK